MGSGCHLPAGLLTQHTMQCFISCSNMGSLLATTARMAVAKCMSASWCRSVAKYNVQKQAQALACIMEQHTLLPSFCQAEQCAGCCLWAAVQYCATAVDLHDPGLVDGLLCLTNLPPDAFVAGEGDLLLTLSCHGWSFDPSFWNRVHSCIASLGLHLHRLQLTLGKVH